MAADGPKADTEKQNYPVVLLFKKSHGDKAVKGEYVSTLMYLELRLPLQLKKAGETLTL